MKDIYWGARQNILRKEVGDGEERMGRGVSKTAMEVPQNQPNQRKVLKLKLPIRVVLF